MSKYDNWEKHFESNINRKCPKCNSLLYIVLHGLVMSSALKYLKENDIPFRNEGCCCYGDNRDAKYWCETCNTKFDDGMKEIILIRCPRVVDFKIRKEECGKERIIKKKYKQKGKAYCKACKLLQYNDEKIQRQ